MSLRASNAENDGAVAQSIEDSANTTNLTLIT
jgi:hypothetical protein